MEKERQEQLQEGNLQEEHLQEGNLQGEHLQEGNLQGEHLQEGNLQEEHLQGEHLRQGQQQEKRRQEERQQEPQERQRRIAFTLRVLHNQIKQIIHKSSPQFETGPKTQLQGGILGYLFHHINCPVYQRDLEKEFRISRATATSTLQVMEREGLIVRKAQDKDARLKRIQMTGQAYQNHKQVEEHMDMMEMRMQQGMTEEEKEQLRRLLGILQGNLEKFAEELDALPTASESKPGGN